MSPFILLYIVPIWAKYFIPVVRALRALQFLTYKSQICQAGSDSVCWHFMVWPHPQSKVHLFRSKAVLGPLIQHAIAIKVQECLEARLQWGPLMQHEIATKETSGSLCVRFRMFGCASRSLLFVAFSVFTFSYAVFKNLGSRVHWAL